jgi:UDP-N-acetylglucosamine 2-epimerase (non-hydrolysing)
MRSRILTIFGTRPEAIKLAPVIGELRQSPDHFAIEVAITGQHRELLDQVLRTFAIEPDHDLDVMTPGQHPLDVLTRVESGLRPLIEKSQPDLVLVQGDTTTTLAAALSAAYLRVPLAHVEAGLRSGSVTAPFPEEVNRRVTTQLASYHFASTERARQNLLAEGVPAERISLTGNTVVDALIQTLGHLNVHPVDLREVTPQIDWDSTRVILVTGHRRESFGKGFGEICDALDEIAKRHPDIHLVYPVHLNPQVHDIVHARLSRRPNIHLIEPIDYLPFVQMMAKCHLILTDSGGIQEEAPTLNRPVLVMRDRTERPETIEIGAGRLVGTDRRRIVEEVELLLQNPDAHRRMAHVDNPHGDGRAAARIVNFLRVHAPFTLE